MKTSKKNIFAERGAELVEFAIAFPLFCAMAMGSVEMGWLFYQQSLLDYATRMGARYASVDTGNVLNPYTSTDISTAAKDVIRNAVRQFGGTMPTYAGIYLKNPWPDQPNRTFALIAEEAYKPVTGKLIPYISNITKISSTATMYCEACG